jgi:hypothetical protein
MRDSQEQDPSRHTARRLAANQPGGAHSAHERSKVASERTKNRLIGLVLFVVIVTGAIFWLPFAFLFLAVPVVLWFERQESKDFDAYRDARLRRTRSDNDLKDLDGREDR